MRKNLRASALLLTLCVPALAGDIPNPSTSQPPPRGITAEELAQVGDNIQNGTVESLTDAVMTALESVLSIF